MSLETLAALAETYSPGETADRIGVTVTTLANWRWRGGGPRYIKAGGRVRYRLIDLVEWMDERRRTSTSDDSVRRRRGHGPANPHEGTRSAASLGRSAGTKLGSEA